MHQSQILTAIRYSTRCKSNLRLKVASVPFFRKVVFCKFSLILMRKSNVNGDKLWTILLYLYRSKINVTTASQSTAPLPCPPCSCLCTGGWGHPPVTEGQQRKFRAKPTVEGMKLTLHFTWVPNDNVHYPLVQQKGDGMISLSNTC